jgi:hypothetical protein
VAREHVRAGGERRLEGAERLVVLPLQCDLDEDIDAEADRRRIDDRPVAEDHAGAFQVLQPPRHRRGRQAHRRAEIDGRQPPRFRQGGDDLAVE